MVISPNNEPNFYQEKWVEFDIKNKFAQFMRSAPNNVAVQMMSWKCYFARMVHGESLQHLAGANGVEAHSGTNGARGPFKLAVKTSIDDGTTWNLSELFEISPPTYSLTRTPW